MYQKSRNLLHVELLDLADGFGRWRFWGLLAWYDIKSRYSRTWLGPIWTLVSLLFFVGLIGVVYTEIMNQELTRTSSSAQAGLFGRSFRIAFSMRATRS